MDDKVQHHDAFQRHESFVKLDRLKCHRRQQSLDNQAGEMAGVAGLEPEKYSMFMR